MNVFCIKNGIIEKRRKGKRIYLKSQNAEIQTNNLYAKSKCPTK